MPYTPPSHNSPASSKPVSPQVSRSSSYSEHGIAGSPIHSSRPNLPRSMSSASYLSRHRRTPSISQRTDLEAPPTPSDSTSNGVEAHDYAPSASLRQSPPPINNLLIPTGAILSPPDSSENSDGDETHEGLERGRALEIRKLQEAVRGIDVKREPSPDTLRNTKLAASEPVSQIVSPSALTPEARKISHSRSATETVIVLPRTTSFAESPAGTSDDSDEDALAAKPSLVRKKSGELVKPALRASSRRRYSSMPGTPTYSKSVHFNDNDNQTRHFLQVDKPIAVSAGSSPVESTYESETEYPFDKESKRDIKLANFPQNSFQRSIQPVRVERIFLSADKQTLIGTCAVQNLAFHKLVVARFTTDYWKTTSEVVAEYHNDPRDPAANGCDRFNFHIKLSDAANIDEKTLLLCVRYAVGGQEYWDNNNSMNYQVDFIKTKPVKSARLATSRNNTHPQQIPRSRHSPPASSHGRSKQESVDDDFGARIDSNSSYHFGTPDTLVGEAPTSIKLKPKSKRGSIFPIQASQTGNNLGGRYDFGASLSAALTQAQEKLGRNSGLLGTADNKSSGSYFAPQERKEGPSASERDKPNLAGDRPAMGSDQYRDLVQKFCYVGSPTITNAPILASQQSSSTTTTA